MEHRVYYILIDRSFSERINVIVFLSAVDVAAASPSCSPTDWGQGAVAEVGVGGGVSGLFPRSVDSLPSTCQDQSDGCSTAGFH